MFRFSLKWILAAMVYAAIAAAAFSQESWVYADLLCAASLLALGYAVMLIIYARGARQAAAAGFAVFMLLLAVLHARCADQRADAANSHSGGRGPDADTPLAAPQQHVCERRLEPGAKLCHGDDIEQPVIT